MAEPNAHEAAIFRSVLSVLSVDKRISIASLSPRSRRACRKENVTGTVIDMSNAVALGCRGLGHASMESLRHYFGVMRALVVGSFMAAPP
jgi:Asp/Glu/hydantoin racemase